MISVWMLPSTLCWSSTLFFPGTQRSVSSIWVSLAQQGPFGSPDHPLAVLLGRRHGGDRGVHVAPVPVHRDDGGLLWVDLPQGLHPPIISDRSTLSTLPSSASSSGVWSGGPPAPPAAPGW